MALSCPGGGRRGGLRMAQRRVIASCARLDRRFASNDALSVNGWSVSRPSNITVLRKRRLAVGSGRRYTETARAETP